MEDGRESYSLAEAQKNSHEDEEAGKSRAKRRQNRGNRPQKHGESHDAFPAVALSSFTADQLTM